MPAYDGRRGDLRGLGLAFENLQGRKSQEGIGQAVLRALWRFGRGVGGGGWHGAGAAIGCWQCWGEDAAESWSAGWWAPGLAAQRAVN